MSIDVGVAEELAGQQVIAVGRLDLRADVADVLQRLRDRLGRGHELTARQVDRGHQVRVLARRSGHHERSGQRRFEPIGEFGVAEVKERGLGE
jgi:hypothetical protein